MEVTNSKRSDASERDIAKPKQLCGQYRVASNKLALKESTRISSISVASNIYFFLYLFLFDWINRSVAIYFRSQPTKVLHSNWIRRIALCQQSRFLSDFQTTLFESQSIDNYFLMYTSYYVPHCPSIDRYLWFLQRRKDESKH